MAKKSKGESPNKSVLDSWIANNKRNRLFILGGAAVLGLLITPALVLVIECLLNCIAGLLGYSLFGNSDNKESANGFRVNLALIVMSLLVLLALWWFRTHDTREQIDKADAQIKKAKEQIEKAQQQIDASIESRETSTRDSQLSTGLQLIADTDVAARCIGLVQLALVRSRNQELEEKLRKQLEDQIDASTQSLTLYRKNKDDSEEIIKLSEAKLENMNLRGAIMTGAHLEGAHLNGANMFEVDLKGAHLNGAHLVGTNLWGAHLNGIDLQGAYLEGACLVGVKLQQTDSEGGHWRQANLEGAILKGAHLEGVNLNGVMMKDADLRKSKSSGQGANLVGANLEGTNLLGALWQGANFKYATYNKSTQLPDDLRARAEEQGLIKVD